MGTGEAFMGRNISLIAANRCRCYLPDCRIEGVCRHMPLIKKKNKI
jgi:hypothetical protein